MTVRRATAADAAEVAALLGELGYPSEAADVVSRLDDTDCVLLADGGLMALHRIPRIAEGGAVARITALVVAADRRGDGVGRELLEAAEALAREWSCELLEVSSGRRPEREPAHRFYVSAGFEDSSGRSVRYRKRL